MKKVVFIIPMFNASPHIKELIGSLKEQTNENWEAVFIDDMSTDDSLKMINICSGGDKRIKVIKNSEKQWALYNVVVTSKQYIDNLSSENEASSTIIAVLDADDSLCNENTVQLLINAYKDEKVDCVWTAHTWDINGMNISKDMPNVNPYQFPWVSSHLKTWRGNLINKVKNENFKDLDGNWFKRGYDQALYLPLLYKARKRHYVNEICYLYRINSSSIKVREWNEKCQMDTIRLVRARGYVE